MSSPFPDPVNQPSRSRHRSDRTLRLANPVQTGAADGITRPAWGLPDAALGLLAFMLVPLAGGVLVAVLGGGQLTPPLILLSLVVVWVTILGVCLLVSRLRGYGSLAKDFGLRFKWIDIAIGIGCGIVARLMILGLTALLVFLWPPPDGHMPTTNIGVFLTGDTLWLIINAFIGGVLIAPVLEELFFRGFILRAVQNAWWLRRQKPMPASAPVAAPPMNAVPSRIRQAVPGRSLKAASTAAVLISAVVFSLVHAGSVPDLYSTVILLVSIFVMGIVCATLTVLTGRLGPAIVTHMAFNGIAMVLALVLNIG
ncbi:CPBP family intramembrane glutamic endopeptidase [Arthrobacter castelli]|uniref:CPBP family intramembrane glutamic endopeptidase n=1 Tax=Arthrobacter castelli TaxID=271431 RepID=UPI00047D6A6F|nr:type II CAAX endopeptidase family protein [Arthrobacter castelli]